MVKIILMDYTGTMVSEDDPYTTELLKIFLANSDLKDPVEAMKTVWSKIKKSEWEHYKDTFITKDAMVDQILTYCAANFNLKADLNKMHEIWKNSWIYAPLFEDVKPFLSRCTLPVYVVTNDALTYVEQSFAEKEITVAGIISSESVRANKPHEEILLEALRVAGVTAAEAVLIGDSESSDVICAQKVGITPILIDRKGAIKRNDIQVIRSLDEIRY